MRTKYGPRNGLWEPLQQIDNYYESYLSLQQPGCRKDEGDVGDHEHEASPGDGKGGDLVVLLQDVGDDHQLGPLEGVGRRVQDEQEEDEPAFLVGREFWENERFLNYSQSLILGKRMVLFFKYYVLNSGKLLKASQ